MGMYEELHTAVKDHSGLSDDDLLQVAEHGAEAGFSGFIYYTDTCKFYEDNEQLIYDLLNEMADDMGYSSPDELVATFRCDTSSPDARKNALAWFALEQAACLVERKDLFHRRVT